MEGHWREAQQGTVQGIVTAGKPRPGAPTWGDYKSTLRDTNLPSGLVWLQIHQKQSQDSPLPGWHLCGIGVILLYSTVLKATASRHRKGRFTVYQKSSHIPLFHSSPIPTSGLKPAPYSLERKQNHWWAQHPGNIS